MMIYQAIICKLYTYRPDGMRHSIGDTIHLWDGANIVADVKGNNVSVYIRGINLIYADDGNEVYYHFNAHGDVVVLTDEDGTKEKSYSYNAFGVEEDPSALDDNPFRYCGEYFDKVNEKIYLRARYYDANQGRFTQEDPIRDGSNWYSYCGGNPVMFVDPTGYALVSCFGDGSSLLGSGNGILPYDSCGGGGTFNERGANYAHASKPTISELIGELSEIENFEHPEISTGALVAAGITANFDGPLPVGDLIAFGILAIAATEILTFPIIQQFTAPTISLPEVRVESEVLAQATTKAKVEADIKIKNTVKKDSEIRYWMAYRDTEINAIIITTPLSEKMAIEHVKSGGDVFTVTAFEAYELAYKAGGNVEPMYDDVHGGGKLGYYYHYHVQGHTNDAHIWYLF